MPDLSSVGDILSYVMTGCFFVMFCFGSMELSYFVRRAPAMWPMKKIFVLVVTLFSLTRCLFFSSLPGELFSIETRLVLFFIGSTLYLSAFVSLFMYWTELLHRAHARPTQFVAQLLHRPFQITVIFNIVVHLIEIAILCFICISSLSTVSMIVQLGYHSFVSVFLVTFFVFWAIAQYCSVWKDFSMESDLTKCRFIFAISTVLCVALLGRAGVDAYRAIYRRHLLTESDALFILSLVSFLVDFFPLTLTLLTLRYLTVPGEDMSESSPLMINAYDAQGSLRDDSDRGIMLVVDQPDIKFPSKFSTEIDHFHSDMSDDDPDDDIVRSPLDDNDEEDLAMYHHDPEMLPVIDPNHLALGNEPTRVNSGRSVQYESSPVLNSRLSSRSSQRSRRDNSHNSSVRNSPALSTDSSTSVTSNSPRLGMHSANMSGSQQISSPSKYVAAEHSRRGNPTLQRTSVSSTTTSSNRSSGFNPNALNRQPPSDKNVSVIVRRNHPQDSTPAVEFMSSTSRGSLIPDDYSSERTEDDFTT